MYGGIMFGAGIIFSALLLTGYIKIPQIFATSSWNQTDWSSGVGASTTNQYASASQINATSTSGQFSFTQQAELLSNTDFETDTNGWESGVYPKNVAGLKAWYKADNITGLSDGEAVATWGDSSASGYDATQSNSLYRPLYKTNIINGKPVVRFDGSNDYLQKTTVSGFTNAASTIIFQKINGSQCGGSYELGLNGGVNTGLSHLAWCGSTNYSRVGGAGSGDITWAYSVPYTNVIAQIYNGSTTSHKAWENGTLKNTTVVNASFGTAPNTITLGALTPTNYWLQTDIGELILFNTALSDGDRNQLNAYIQRKWGLASSSHTITRDTSIKYSGTASLKIVAISQNTNIWQLINTGDTGNYILSAYVYKDGGAVTSDDVVLYAGGTSLSSSYTDIGSGWYRMTAAVTGSTIVKDYGATVLNGKTIYIDDFSLTQYPSTATLTSNIFDASTGHDWGIVSYAATTPAGTSVSVKVRSSNASDMTGAPAFASCTAIASGALASTGGCVTNNHQYVQYEVTLAGDGSATPTFSDITINMTPSDTTAPTSNASFLTLKTSPTGTTITASTYTQSGTPYLSFTAGADNGGGSGLKGYCVYLGTDSLADPATTKGMLGTSPVSTTGSTCQFIIASTALDLSTSGYIGTALTSSASPYYLLLKAIDNGNNIYQGASASFAFLYDGTAPTNVAYLSTPSTIYSNVNEMVFSWPTAGASSASDTHSGVLGYQYQINSSSGTWKGTTTSSECGLDYIPVAEGSRTLTTLADGGEVVIGNNVIYLRTVDSVCNTSSPSSYRTGNIEYGGEAPSFAISCSSTTGVVVTPLTNTTNSFSFAWDEATPSNTNTITNYYYMVNTQPPGALSTITSNNSTYIDVGTTTSVSTRSFTGLVKGTNTVYVVAKDSAGNYSSSTCVKGTFTLNSDYPDPPKNTTVSDASIKTSSLWRASLAWSTPDYTGTGSLTYTVSRSEDGVTWTAVTTTSGTAYVDTVAESKKYYFKVCSKDTSSESIATPSCANTITITPKGSFTTAPDLASGPAASGITTKKATIKWTTSRNSDSKVAYGTGSNSYFTEEPSNSTQVTDHTINLTNLSPGVTYYYKTKWTDEDGNTGVSAEKSFKTEDAPTVKDVSATKIGLDSATIKFTSLNASKVKIYYGTTTSFGGTKEIATSTSETAYTTEIAGLTDNTKYYYKINTFDSDGSEYETLSLDFTTLPRPRITNVRFQEVAGAAQPAIIVSWDTNTETSSIITYYPQGRVGDAKDEVSVALIKGPHKVLLKGLNPQVVYQAIVKGKDKAGNEAVSDAQTFTTSTDTRPPQVLNLRIEGSSDTQSSSGGIEDAKSQLVVSWDTDEPSTSQVEYGEGTGSTYSQKTQEDTNLTTNHIIIISNLTPSRVYHLRTLSKDKAQNTGQSVDTVTITPKSSRSALELVIGNMSDVFGILAR